MARYLYDCPEYAYYIEKACGWLFERMQKQSVVLVPAKEVADYAEALRLAHCPQRKVQFVVVPFSQIK